MSDKSATNYYAESGLDRAAHLREQDDWLERLIEDAAAQFVPIWRSRNLIADCEVDPSLTGVQAIMSRPSGEPRAALVQAERARTLVDLASELVLLGMRDQTAFVAVDLSSVDDPHSDAPISPDEGVFLDLRAVGPVIDRFDGALLAYARGMMTWHRRHRFCGICGTPTESAQAGHIRRCPNPDCGTTHFPRTDPAVIMLVTDGDRALLGRQAAWPEGRYSTLAGFVEPGETLEAAVAREVYEEAGIRVDNVRYHSSQPWPFPSSVMLGFHARARSTEISINDQELEDAQWFDREWLMHGRRAAGMGLPRKDSIARRLIEDWLIETA